MKILVKTGASDSAQTFRQEGETRSGPAAFLVFSLWKSLQTSSSLIFSAGGRGFGGEGTGGRDGEGGDRGEGGGGGYGGRDRWGRGKGRGEVGAGGRGEGGRRYGWEEGEREGCGRYG